MGIPWRTPTAGDVNILNGQRRLARTVNGNIVCDNIADSETTTDTLPSFADIQVGGNIEAPGNRPTARSNGDSIFYYMFESTQYYLTVGFRNNMLIKERFDTQPT